MTLMEKREKERRETAAIKFAAPFSLPSPPPLCHRCASLWLAGGFEWPVLRLNAQASAEVRTRTPTLIQAQKVPSPIIAP